MGYLPSAELVSREVLGRNAIAPCGKELRFVSHSVGFVFCGPARSCVCAKQQVSEKCKKSKNSLTEDQEIAIRAKREKTNIERYGVKNPFELEKVKAIVRGSNTPARAPEVNERRIKTNLSRYGVSNAALNTEVKRKTQETNIERYGGISPLCNAEVQQRAQATVMSKHGGLGLASPNIRAKIQNPSLTTEGVDKIKKGLRARYQDSVLSRLATDLIMLDTYDNVTTHYTLSCKICSTVFKDRFYAGGSPQCPTCYPRGKSYLETELVSWVHDIGIENIIPNTRKIISPFEVDVFLPDFNLAIEMNGLYYHSEERVGRTYHLDKTLSAISKGVRLIHIMEDEWREKPHLVKARLLHLMGKSSARRYARKLAVGPVDNKTANNFFNSHHIQGGVRCRLAYGLYDNGELVACMSFGLSRFEADVWEILRFATNGSVVGAGSRLFKYFLKSNLNVTRVVTYADRRWGEGESYYKLGFSFVSSTPPSYRYFLNKKSFNRMQFQKHKLVAEGFAKEMTERQIMAERGYGRIYDCGHNKYLWSRS